VWEPPARIAVLGAGRTGEAVARWALARLAGRNDSAVAVFSEGDDPASRETARGLIALGARVSLGASALDGAPYDIIVASPGIAPHRPLMVSARALGVPVISELELAWRVSRAPFVAVTGTNGKTTVTALVAHLLRTSGLDARAVGNIGQPAILEAAAAPSSALLVAECSSFQLALTGTFHPKVSVLLNITPDHVDWHGSLAAYEQDKVRVFANQGAGDTAVVDIDDPVSAAWASRLVPQGVRVVRISSAEPLDGGGGVIGDMLSLDTGSGPVALVPTRELRIRGRHNVNNALAAAAASVGAGAGIEAVREGLRSFEPIEHRLQTVTTRDGVTYVNDSKATNPEAVLKALGAFEDDPIIILLGGRNKHNEFSTLAEACARVCRTVVLFGEARSELAAAFDAAGGRYEVAGTMAEAVRKAQAVAVAGDVVLLSPACASFDEFEGFEDRGRTFARLVCGAEER
jgi:UDP-N-acetylmuramoylalanine--D-glutamate ligase